MSEISPEVVDAMMVKCARRCCICRRFRPTKLQVHHIKEQSKGGADDESNLIVVCFSCHTDVHTNVPFARRFSNGELIGHRDALVRAIANGQLPVDDTDDTDEAVARLIASLHQLARPLDLLPEAAEILVKAVSGEGWAQGAVHAINYDGGFVIKVAGAITLGEGDRRTQVRYKHGLKQLLNASLLDHVSGEQYEVSYDGYLVADEVLSRGPDFLSEDQH